MAKFFDGTFYLKYGCANVEKDFQRQQYKGITFFILFTMKIFLEKVSHNVLP